MTVWILYLLIDGSSIEHPYHFAFKDTCVQTGKIMVKDYMYEGYRCIKESYDNKKRGKK